MVYTKEKFKELWEANEHGGGFTCNDCADCIDDAWVTTIFPELKESDSIDSLVEQSPNRPYYIEGRGIYIPIINKVLAMEDAFEGTIDKWENNVKADVPTKEEWYIILYFKDDIQRLLKENGGQPLRNSYYWCFTECLTYNFWVVSFSIGIVSNLGNRHDNLRIRTITSL